MWYKTTMEGNVSSYHQHGEAGGPVTVAKMCRVFSCLYLFHIAFWLSRRCSLTPVMLSVQVTPSRNARWAPPTGRRPIGTPSRTRTLPWTDWKKGRSTKPGSLPRMPLERASPATQRCPSSPRTQSVSVANISLCGCSSLAYAVWLVLREARVQIQMLATNCWSIF